MADTFFSWFLVTELHVWMIMVRYMADEKDGKIVRNSAVAAMWEDTRARVENLGVGSTFLIYMYTLMYFHNFINYC